MKKHIVTCVKCGRQFDANEGGAYYPESRRYVCKRCVDKQKSEQADREKARKAEERKAEADERERVTGMRQSKAAMLVKIVVGVLFLFAAVSLAVQGNISSFVCGLVIGGALVAWGLVPYLKAKKREAVSYVCQLLEAPKVNERFPARSRPPAYSA